MSLESGMYKIYNGDDQIGRAVRETMDLSPKSVFNQTDDTEAVWVVEQLPNGRHKLFTKGAPTAVEGGKSTGAVVSLLINQHDAAEWELQPVDGQDGAYRVLGPNGSLWVTPEPGQHCQIEVMPIDGDGDHARFSFERVED
ncbi:I66 family serine proteinase inhibitor [Streptomyces sp. NPDC056682]|uniref:I66 family serine proteinase inhibitor n=1 Tax=Streptomyces sp. NPDC056682 TaxID=3345909 RepID=UPI00367A9D2C